MKVLKKEKLIFYIQKQFVINKKIILIKLLIVIFFKKQI